MPELHVTVEIGTDASCYFIYSFLDVT